MLRASVIGMVLVLILTTTPEVIAAKRSVEKDELARKLRGVANQVELMIVNQRADEADRRRLEADIRHLRLYDRIPLKDDLGTAKKQITAGALSYNLRVQRISVGKAAAPAPPPPRKIFADGAPFKFTPEQVARSIPLELHVAGSRDSVERWVKGWREEQLRLMELRNGPAGIQPAGPDSWTVQAAIFTFRPLRFPQVVIRDPSSTLPSWARREGELSALATRIRQAAPKATPLYEARGQFIVAAARMSFFLKRTVFDLR